jgi:hypothetical protein
MWPWGGRFAETITPEPLVSFDNWQLTPFNRPMDLEDLADLTESSLAYNDWLPFSKPRTNRPPRLTSWYLGLFTRLIHPLEACEIYSSPMRLCLLGVVTPIPNCKQLALKVGYILR